MNTHRPAPFHASRLLPIALFPLAMLSACGGGSSSSTQLSGGLVVLASQTAGLAGVAGAPLAVGDRIFVYLASEPDSGATDLNGDTDALDEVAVAFDRQTRQSTPLAAARGLCLVGEEVYLSVSEAEDGRDWSGDGMPLDDLVLLHWSRSAPTLTFVDVLRRERLECVSDRLYYSAEPQMAPTGLETTLRYLDAAAPTTPVTVVAASAIAGEDPLILGADNGLLFLRQDETVAQRDFNGDGDDDDTAVLALLDATDPAAAIGNVSRAIAASSPPYCARPRGSGDWLVAFLVVEADQAGMNLNDPARFDPSWVPPQCSGLEDSDTLDQVLFYLEFADWSADPGNSPPVDTGLVGQSRVLASYRASSGRSFVATLSPEASEGSCSLNGDGDQNDTVLRWAEVLPGGDFDPVRDADLILAVAQVPGGVRGFVEERGRWVAVVSEANDGRDHDPDDTSDDDILAWIDPTEATLAWTFPLHPGQGTALGVDWMADDDRGDGFVFTDVERVIGIACNSADSDMDDSFALIGAYDENSIEGLRWNGYCYAVEPFNAGGVQVGNVLFLRVDEDAQGRDLNEDGDRDDQVLLCHTVFPLGRLYFIGTLNDLPGPAVARGDEGTVVYLSDEAMASRDLNDDGDMDDLVPRYLRLN